MNDPGVQGLAQLGRNAIDRVSELERGIAKRDETIRQLRARAVNAEADNGQLTQGATLSPQERIEIGKLVASLGVRNIVAGLRERDELRAQLDEYEREKLKRESQEPVAFRWLGPGKGWRAVYAEPPAPHVDPDWLSNVIRAVAPHLCAERDELAEKNRRGDQWEGEMTTDELRRMLELAARAQGIHGNVVDLLAGGPIGLGFNWLHNDGDSARMRTVLRINVIWSDNAVHCLNSLGEAVESFADHNGDRNAALRLCALKVAAMIGEGME